MFDALYEHDPELKNYEHHLKYRWSQFAERKAAIEEAEGSLLNFSKGYVLCNCDTPGTKQSCHISGVPSLVVFPVLS